MSKINFSKVTSRLKDAGIMAAGTVASNYASTMIDKVGAGKITPVMNAGIRLGIGALLPGFLGESKKAGMVTNFANGVLTESALALAKALHIPGIHGTDVDNPIGDYSVMQGTELDSPIGTAN